MFISGILSEKNDVLRIKNTLEKVVKLYCLDQLEYDISYYVIEGFGLVSVTLKDRYKFEKIYVSEDQEMVVGLHGCVSGYSERDSVQKLLDLYKIHGTDFVKKLDGTFNIIIYSKENKDLNIYNDSYAFNKLYYKNTEENELYFGTNIKSVLLIDKIINQRFPKIEAYSLLELCWFGHFLKENTLFTSVKCLSFASNLYFKNELLDIKSYWFPKFKINKQREKVNYTNKIINAMLTSIKRMFEMINDQDETVGISLSGGLDSRMMTAAVEKIGLKPQTYTYGDRSSRDLILGKKVANSLGLKNIQIKLDDYTISYGRKFAVWQCEGETWGIGPVYHKELIHNNIKYKVTGVCGGDLFLGGHIMPFMLLPISENKLLEKLFYGKARISESIIKEIFNNKFYQNYSDKLKEEFFHSFKMIKEDAFYKKCEIWAYVYKVIRGIFSNNVDRYYFCLLNPFQNKAFLELWLNLPLNKKILQIYFKKALLRINEKTRYIPYALTNFKVRNNFFSEIFFLTIHNIKGRIHSRFKRNYKHPGKEILDVRKEIMKDINIRKDIERFMASDNFPEEILNRDGITKILNEHYLGKIDGSTVIIFILNIATVYEYFIKLKDEIPAEVASFADELFMP